MKSILSILALSAALVFPTGCSTTQQANASAHLKAFNAEVAAIGKDVLIDVNSPAGQQLILDAVSAVYAGTVAASGGSDSATASVAIAGAINAVHAAAALPTLTGNQLAQSINTSAIVGTSTLSNVGATVNTVYTSLTGKGVPPKSALAAIETGLAKAKPVVS